MLDADPEHITAVVSVARDTVDMYVQEVAGIQVGDPQREEKIRMHPSMTDFTHDWKSLLEQLIKIDTNHVTKEMIERLRIRRPIVDLNALST